MEIIRRRSGLLMPEDIKGLRNASAAHLIRGLNDNDPVSSLKDYAGGFDLTSTGTARPLYKTGTVRPSILFDGVNDYLRAAFPDTYNQRTIAIVFQMVTTGSVNRICDSFSTINSGGIQIANVGTQFAIRSTSIGAGVLFGAGTINNFNIIIGRFNSANSEAYQNGRHVIFGDAGTNGTYGGLTIGAQAGLSNHGNMSYYEHAVWDRLLTNKECEGLGNYLKRFYNMS